MMEPLPYVVRLRVAAGDDARPVVTEVRGLAYSPLDAVTQAVVETIGMAGTSNTNYKIESVGPDIEAWRKLRDEEKARDAKKQGLAAAPRAAGPAES